MVPYEQSNGPKPTYNKEGAKIRTFLTPMYKHKFYLRFSQVPNRRRNSILTSFLPIKPKEEDENEC
jgi:hypothetical protein